MRLLSVESNWIGLSTGVRFRLVEVDDERFSELIREDVSQMEIAMLNAGTMQPRKVLNQLNPDRNVSMANNE